MDEQNFDGPNYAGERDNELVLCDRCRKEFKGEAWMQDTEKEILCPACYGDEQNVGEDLL